MDTCLNQIRDLLELHGVAHEVITHPHAETTQEASAAAGISGYEFAKSVLLMVDEQPHLFVLPAADRIDMEALRRQMRPHDVRIAEEPEMLPLFPGSQSGSIPAVPLTNDLPVHIDNDAKALALGEGWVGAARGVRDYVAMVVSTGVGGGIVLDGRLLDGAAGNAGHIGHVIVEPEGRTCACGAQGCLEAEASGTAIAARTGRPPAEASPDERARAGRLVGRAVASVANLLDLKLAVVAGSVALGFGDVFFDAAQAELDRSARLGFSSGARIVPGGLGDAGPLIGAAAVAYRSRAIHRPPG